MTNEEAIALLRKEIEKRGKGGQSAVAREVGKSSSALSQILGGTYKADASDILRRVAELYGKETTKCPELGEISLKRCADERVKPFSASSPFRVALHLACKDCTHNR